MSENWIIKFTVDQASNPSEMEWANNPSDDSVCGEWWNFWLQTNKKRSMDAALNARKRNQIL
jgi:hypothetical protein